MLNRMYHMLYGIRPRNYYAYRFCALYADRYRGENNRDKKRNGEFDLLRRTLPECRVVFDAGAFIGQWAEEALHLNPDITLHCFEPCHETFSRLQQRFSDSNANVTLINSGLGESSGEATFYPFSKVKQASSLYVREGSPDQLGTQASSESVAMDTIDDYCARAAIENIDFLKLDVEGHELAVLLGAQDLLAQRAIRWIQFEYGSANIYSRVFFRDLYNLLTESGYRVYKLFPGRIEPICTYEPRLDNFQYANYVASLTELDS